ncbi:striatin-3-like isoform X2 [Argiope bruennichi]|uniref:striatin-3-like isoform X2 n=1 Tax=Argiope bruennichi TaxID=94029 RepID=UPI002494DB8C|nr:striatin-3-like isoform X2 [Argiope bruennichi]
MAFPPASIPSSPGDKLVGKVNGDHAMMEDVSATQNHSVQLPSGGFGINSKQSQDEHNQRPHYSIPGILHFIQHEWARFEMERAQWEVERAELQARIAFLQGERKGQENLKNDLIRRIKMLEYALKQERVKFHKLKYGTDPNFTDLKAPIFDDIDEPVDGDPLITSNSNVSWRQGRQLLRQYLQEIGYTDTIIDVRSARVRTLLGLAPSNAENEEKQHLSSVLNGEQKKRPYEPQQRRIGKITHSVTENALMDAEQSVLDTFDFLSSENVDMDDDDENLSDEMDDACAVDDEDNEILEKKAKSKTKSTNEITRDDGISETSTEEALAEFNFLGSSDAPDRPQGENTDWVIFSGVQGGTPLSFPPGSRRPLLGGPGNEDDTLEAALGLGELASLTVNNEADTSYDISSAKEAFRKTWNAKYTLRSHFDGVRALAFHPVEPVLITASEDHTLKLWNLQKTVPAKKTASLDVEPVYTFRAHIGPVLCLALSTTGDQCFSGGMDGTIRCWNVPSSLSDPYDSFDPSVLTNTLKGHTDAVWGLSIHSSKLQLLSCSADGTVRLWSPQSKVPLLHTYGSNIADGNPTSVDFLRCDMTQMVAAYTSSNSVIFDLETGKPVIRLDSNQTPDASPLGKQINCIVCHPTLPLTVTAHEDRHIRFFDNNTGKMIHSMVAHLDAVTSLAIDPNGLYLLSGSHDCSIRLWNMDNKTCVQEITSHRKKFDEAIFDVAFHPSKPYIASAGADALAKVFV